MQESEKKEKNIEDKGKGDRRGEMSKSLNPRVWGPGLWDQLHRFAFEYSTNPTEAEKEEAKRVFTSDIYAFVFCDSCKTHWAAMMKEHPPAVESGAALARWLVDRHNQVNERLGKPIWTFEQASRAYLAKRNTPASDLPVNSPPTTLSYVQEQKPPTPAFTLVSFEDATMLTSIIGVLLLLLLMRSAFRPRLPL